MPITSRSVVADGHTIALTEAGPADAPVIVLLHGLASDSGTWDRAVGPLAAHGLHVYAVDLLGHGASDKPRHGYLLDDFAASLRDLFRVLGIASATVCGHSLGGAVAVHFCSQHPDLVDRLVLVSAGGLGREVHPVLRAAALPVAPAVLRLVTRPALRRLYRSPGLHRALRLTPDNVVNLRRAGRALGDAAGQAAFFAALRGVIEPGGQRGNFMDMGTLAAHVPTMLVWNEGDPVIPVRHARAAHEHLPGSRLLVFPNRSHEPHRASAQHFADEVAAFVAETDPAMRDDRPLS
ncbi:Pimeloyl-ACP methyl ester carboxylesterase [Jatrophihabitans endophyticus]|uniref:Pimeloyl-ACP methyl ester carboxylesterase n=1 Tax=Jatrophihabitans endophyticus TaxID=1206085 RepID=A0A1M5H6K3_9ACTN|nr:alpha/beta fold hydrolase [Jatrophihabitans endophyticus]SHG11661.1 Pimeloyl-ACP methyl ester carboxylesterase [Jatrophihabitans endophyticus]